MAAGQNRLTVAAVATSAFSAYRDSFKMPPRLRAPPRAAVSHAVRASLALRQQMQVTIQQEIAQRTATTRPELPDRRLEEMADPGTSQLPADDARRCEEAVARLAHGVQLMWLGGGAFMVSQSGVPSSRITHKA